MWYGSTFSVDLNLTDGQTHQIALYFVDWDTTDRGQQIDVRDAVTGALLDSQSLNNYNNGVYLVWQLKGHVTIQFTNTRGYNAVLSGLFFR